MKDTGMIHLKLLLNELNDKGRKLDEHAAMVEDSALSVKMLMVSKMIQEVEKYLDAAIKGDMK